MTADDVHAKLVRGLERACEETPAGLHGAQGTALLADLVQPLALASIALELRWIRQELVDVSRSQSHDR